MKTIALIGSSFIKDRPGRKDLEFLKFRLGNSFCEAILETDIITSELVYFNCMAVTDEDLRDLHIRKMFPDLYEELGEKEKAQGQPITLRELFQ